MKIFAFVGSMRGNKSNTLKAVESIISNLKKEIDEKIDTHVYVYSDIKINTCIGCAQCFQNGYCVLDKDDDMKFLKEQMEISDVIIFSSPVYAHQISGNAKNFIDRLSYLFYTFKLAGKIGITVSTSNTNGNTFVDNYLSKILQTLGVYLAGNVSLKLALMKESEIDAIIEKCVSEVSSAYKDKSIIKSTPMQEQLFSLYKKIFISENYNHCYRKYWIERNYFEFNSYNELLETYRTQNKDITNLVVKAMF